MLPAKSFACLVFPCPQACPSAVVMDDLRAQCRTGGFDLTIRFNGASMHLSLDGAAGADAMLVRLICAVLTPGTDAIVFWKEAKMGLPATSFQSHFAGCLPQLSVSPRRIAPKTRNRPKPGHMAEESPNDDLRQIFTQPCSKAPLASQQVLSPWAAGVAAGLTGLFVAIDDGGTLLRFLAP